MRGVAARLLVGLSFFAALVPWLGGSAARAQAAGDPPSPQVDVDLSLGEEMSVKARQEWFFSTRRAGATKPLFEMRAAGVEVAKKQLLQQKALGLDKGVNVWTSRGPGASHFGGWSFGDVSGRIPALAKDWAHNVLYAGGASGGLWKSTDDGGSWTSLFDGTGTTTVGAIALDPNNPNTIWVGTGENTTSCESYFGIGLLRSTDGGATWQNRSAAPLNLSYFGGLVVDPRDSNHLVVGGRWACQGGSLYYGGIYTTNDAGATWTSRLANVVVNSIVQDPANRNTFWAGVGDGYNGAGGIYRSTDNGVTWVRQTVSSLPTGSLARIEITVAPSSGNTVYALFADVAGTPQFWRTTNGGTTWTMMSSGTAACDGQCDYNMVVRAHVTDPNTVFRGNLHVFKSTNGGATWTDLTGNWGGNQKVHQDTHTFLMNPGNAGEFYVGCDGGIWKTSDGGASFTNLNSNLVMTQFYAIGNHPTDDGIIVGGCQDNSSQARTTNDKWDMQAVTGDGMVGLINPVNPSIVYLAGYGAAYPNVQRSTTGVLGTFSPITDAGSGINAGDRMNWVTPYVMDPSNPAVMYLGTQRIYKSTDSGTSWTPVGPPDMPGDGYSNVATVEVDAGHPAYVYAGTTNGKVWMSTDHGVTWNEISPGLPPRAINDLAADPATPGRVFAVVGGFGTAHVWEYSAGAWTARDSGMPNVPANTALLLNASEVYVGNDIGVYRSIDGGASFAPYMNGLPLGAVVTDLKYTPATGTITLGTYGRGAWQNRVPTGAQPNVRFDSVQVPMTQLHGDGDANVEPGETWQVKPVLRDYGLADAQNVTADLATSTPGVTIRSPRTRGYGTVPAGGTAPAADAYTFSIDPSVACGTAITFDLVNIKSSNAPYAYPAQPGAFQVPVLDHYGAPATQTLLNETFDPAPGPSWSHAARDPGLSGCPGPYVDQWSVRVKDAGHGNSYALGAGPGHSYALLDDAWLTFGGKDSTNGAGITIPAAATSATLTLVHWYDAEPTWDGGIVAVDAIKDGIDNYAPISPAGGYPGSIGAGYCNALYGQPAFTGSSNGWVTSTFDLTAYAGKTIYLAFAFGSDNYDEPHEGWYLDTVKIEAQVPPPVCNTTTWPGEVQNTVTLQRTGTSLVATWNPACNAGLLPGQGYALEAGNLNTLTASGTYTHAPLGAVCSRTSPLTFTPGAGNEYYLVVPNSGGMEGSAGRRSDGTVRPQVSAACGDLAIGACP